MTATAAWRARLPTWLSRALKRVRNVSTACRLRSGKSAPPITTFSRKRRRGYWTSRPGWNGSSAVWGAPSMVRKPLSALSDPARAHRLLRHSRGNAEGDIGHHALDGMVPRLSGARHRWCANHSRRCQIRQERTAYYDILEETQKGILDITPWMEWFLGCLGRAIDGAQTTLGAV